jgi:hypothetical protein
MFNVKTRVNNITSHEVGIVLSFLVFRGFSKHFILSVTGMLLYSPVTSIDTGNESGGSWFALNKIKLKFLFEQVHLSVPGSILTNEVIRFKEVYAVKINQLQRL